MNTATAPALSIVVPTAGRRPGLLQRAVLSALSCAEKEDVEVIVVWNGCEARPLDVGDDRIRHLFVMHANANAARNAGMDAARGNYVRFLDDDDCLEPAGALIQLQRMRSSGADISSGSVEYVGRKPRGDVRYLPASSDFVVELFQQRGSTLTTSQMFKRSFLRGVEWNPERRYLQDVEWMHSLMRRGEVNWLPVEDVVGYWHCHEGPRISTIHAKGRRDAPAREAIDIIVGSIQGLEAQGRLTGERRKAAAKALWDYAHGGFRYAPDYWSHVARRALELDPESRPTAALMQVWPLSAIGPIAAERLVFPFRSLLGKVMDSAVNRGARS